MAYDDVPHKREMCDCICYNNMMVYFFFHTLIYCILLPLILSTSAVADPEISKAERGGGRILGVWGLF